MLKINKFNHFAKVFEKQTIFFRSISNLAIFAKKPIVVRISLELLKAESI